MSTRTDTERLMTVAEFSRATGLTEWAIRGLVKRGSLPAVRIERSVRIDPTPFRRPQSPEASA